jgi:hypothetical protein
LSRGGQPLVGIRLLATRIRTTLVIQPPCLWALLHNLLTSHASCRYRFGPSALDDSPLFPSRCSGAASQTPATHPDSVNSGAPSPSDDSLSVSPTPAFAGHFLLFRFAPLRARTTNCFEPFSPYRILTRISGYASAWIYSSRAHGQPPFCSRAPVVN